MKLRGQRIDATWAAWWRAQAKVIALVLRQTGADVEMVRLYEEREENMVLSLENRRAV